MEHTKGPWTLKKGAMVHSNLGVSRHFIILSGEVGLATVDAYKGIDNEANAEFIVRAVNSHEELLKACKLVARAVGDSIDASSKPATVVIDAIVAAIAKAEGK